MMFTLYSTYTTHVLLGNKGNYYTTHVLLGNKGNLSKMAQVPAWMRKSILDMRTAQPMATAAESIFHNQEYAS